MLVERIAEPENIGRIYVPDAARNKGILGKVVAVGPGKWIEGCWWFFRARTYKLGDHERGEWEWIPGYRQEIKVRYGQTVYFNSRWNDVEQLPGGMHLIQEADIFCVVPPNARPATAKSPDLPPLVQSSDPLAHGL